MDIDDITIGQARKLSAALSSGNNAPSKFVGLHVLVRTYSAGVHIGLLTEQSGKSAVLHNSRRLWKWSGAFTLSEVSQSGIDPKNSRMSVEVPLLQLTEVIEIIPTTEAARMTFDKCHE